LFLWVLRAFIKNGSNAASAIEEALRVGDMKLAERHAHTIKSTAGSMGALELVKLAQSLEQAIDQGKPHEIIRSTLKDFAAESERLVTELKSRLTTESQTGEEATLPSEVNVAVVTPIMNRLLDYIRGSDCRAELYLDDYQRELEGVPDKDIAKLKAQLKNFDFDAAHEALLNLTSRNGIMLSHDDSEEYRS
jgi:two-component system sensor histidine kinase/response regulator